MKTILGALGAAAFAGEVYLLWCVAAVGEKGMPFPRFAYILGEMYVWAFCLAAVIAIASAVVRVVIRRRRVRRLGIIRIDRDGNYYYDNK